MARSGVCPTVPQQNTTIFDDTVPVRDQMDVPVPDAAFATCEGATNEQTTIGPRPDGTTVETTVCCPAPGPAGPTGNQGAVGEGVPAGGAVGQKLSKIDGADYNTEWVDVNEVPAGGLAGEVLGKVSDTDYDTAWITSGAGNVTWRGYWTDGQVYLENDIVSHNGTSYIANLDHTSDDFSEPSPEFDEDPGGFEWSLMSAGLPFEEQGLIDGLLDSTGDWLSDIENWGYDDLALLALAGIGLAIAGVILTDMFTDDGKGDGEADSNYTGDGVYVGATIPPTLTYLIARICNHANIQFDINGIHPLLTGVPDPIMNLSIPTITSARNILQMLSRVYFFDMIDNGGAIKFVYRQTQTSVRTLTAENDLGFSKGNAGTSPVLVKRMQGIDLPRSIQIQYVSEAQNYNQMTQEASLEVITEGQNTKISVPMTLGEDEAYTVAERLLVNSNIERTSYSWTTTTNHIDLEPSDVVTLPDYGDVRIIRMEEESDNLISFQGVDAAFNQDTYEASGLPAQAPATITDVAISIGYSAGLAVELPPLDASDTEQRLTLFPHGYGRAGWPGCAIYLSIDNGVTYNNFTSAVKESTWGRVVIATPSISNYHVFDESTSISVELKSGVLSSKTNIDVYNGVNWAIIGKEIIGFRNAVLTAPDTYTLSGLLRGRRGTEFELGNHIADEAFILLDDAGVELPYAIADKEKTVYIKYVTNGSDISKATAFPVQPSQLSRRPWLVTQFAGVNTSNNWALSWTGRNHFSGEMVDGGEITNPDGFRGYLLSFVPLGGGTALRTVIVQGTDYTYTEAQQIADFGSAQASIRVYINQLDELVGPGYVTDKTF